MATPLSSIGEPSWFASPIDVRRTGATLTILFRIPESATELRAESTGASAVLTARLPAKETGWRTHRGARIFALPFECPRGTLRIRRHGSVGEVQIRRRHSPARKAPAASMPERSP